MPEDNKIFLFNTLKDKVVELSSILDEKINGDITVSELEYYCNVLIVAVKSFKNYESGKWMNEFIGEMEEKNWGIKNRYR